VHELRIVDKLPHYPVTDAQPAARAGGREYRAFGDELLDFVQPG